MKDQIRLIPMIDTNMSTTSDYARIHKNIKKMVQFKFINFKVQYKVKRVREKNNA